jgi:hypothetical protein
MRAAPIALTDAQRASIDAAVASLPLSAKLGQLFQVDWQQIRARCGGRHAWPPSQHDGPVATMLTDASLGSVLGGGGAHPQPNTPAGWRAQFAPMQSAARASVVHAPLLVGSDSVHGHGNLAHATLFPHHIGQVVPTRHGTPPDMDMGP